MSHMITIWIKRNINDPKIDSNDINCLSIYTNIENTSKAGAIVCKNGLFIILNQIIAYSECTVLS
jgi:hypothetical protein